jgi:hypothetical protein
MAGEQLKKPWGCNEQVKKASYLPFSKIEQNIALPKKHYLPLAKIRSSQQASQANLLVSERALLQTHTCINTLSLFLSFLPFTHTKTMLCMWCAGHAVLNNTALGRKHELILIK